MDLRQSRHRGSNRWHIATAVAMLTLFLSYIGAISLFPHRHVVDGLIVYHSHPYKGSSSNHTHTTQQLNLIFSLAKYVAVVGQYVINLDATLLLSAVIICKISAAKVYGYVDSFQLRAPPVI